MIAIVIHIHSLIAKVATYIPTSIPKVLDSHFWQPCDDIMNNVQSLFASDWNTRLRVTCLATDRGSFRTLLETNNGTTWKVCMQVARPHCLHTYVYYLTALGSR